MARFRFNRVGSLEELRQEMDRLFDNYLGSLNPVSLLGLKCPPVDIWEDGSAVFVQAEVPGIPAESVHLEVLGNRLRIKGNRPAVPTAGVTVHRQELSSGKFDRLVELPVEVDPTQVEATLKDGLLNITIRKLEVATARRINVCPS